MTFSMNIRYNDLRQTLEPLIGLILKGAILGAPTSKFPLRDLVEKIENKYIVLADRYESVEIKAIKLEDKKYVLCYFNLEEPDDFCISIEREEAIERIVDASKKLSKLANTSFSTMLIALIKALQGVIHREEGEIEVIEDPDTLIEELLTWLPNYISVVD